MVDLITSSALEEGVMSDVVRELDAFEFRDADTGDQCWASVRLIDRKLMLALSRRSDGDVEVPLSREEAQRLARALLEGARTGPSE